MAMQYQQLSSEIQAQGLRTIYLMNPNSLGYSDSNQTPQSNFLNPSAAGHAFTSCLTAHAPPEEITAAVHSLWADHYSSNMPILQQKGPSLNLPRSCDHQISQLYPGESSKYAMADGDMEINVLTGSKYVKAAQELLEEMVSVLGVEGGAKKTVIAKTEDVASVGDGDELTMAHRQEVLMKKARLSGMLEEVDVRRKQYHQRIQLMVSSFEDVAGIGSARAYTEVALHTILRQFGRLRSTILGQIKGLNKRLGEDKEELKMGSRLRMVDRQIMQQRALEQAGMMMMPNAAWRPQRGLPERAVAVLRAWLFDHFLHPYPKDSDKQMLANKAGLTRSQVSNWFINARVRLWKPMVEAMYVEETNSKTNQHHTPIPISSCPESILVPSTKTMSSSLQHQGNPHPPFITHDTHPPPPKKLHCHDTRLSPLAAAATATKLHQFPTTTTTNNPGGALLLDTAVYGNSSICQLNRDHHHGLQGVTSLNTTGFQGNGFSLTLGLSCPETSSAGDRQQNRFMAGKSFGGIDTTTNNNNNLQGNSQSVNGYEIIDFQNRRKATTNTTFQPQSQSQSQSQLLLPDFFGLITG